MTSELGVLQPSFTRRNEEARFYCTGKPCKYGHYANRYVCNNECVECRNEKNKLNKDKQDKWAQENRERRNAVSRYLYHTNIEKQRERTRKKYADNPEKINATNDNWRQRNKERLRSYWAKRRAAKLQRTPSWADMKAISDFYEKCPDGYHVDHIIPLQGKTVCGLHVLENLQYLPAKENLRKFNRLEKQYVYS
jgi:hypothetical protein